MEFKVCMCVCPFTVERKITILNKEKQNKHPYVELSEKDDRLCLNSKFKIVL